jgi:hypothetical protein
MEMAKFLVCQFGISITLNTKTGTDTLIGQLKEMSSGYPIDLVVNERNVQSLMDRITERAAETGVSLPRMNVVRVSHEFC